MSRMGKSDKEWQDQLTPDQYQVCRQQQTERPFTGVYCDSKENGIYRCVCCGNDLFSSQTKYDSRSGWPSFWDAVDPTKIKKTDDHSLSMPRIEVSCAKCDAHLGHLFDDGPQPTGLRYCINSVSLDLDKE